MMSIRLPGGAVIHAAIVEINTALEEDPDNVLLQQKLLDGVELRVGQAITPIEHDLSAMQVATADPLQGLPFERLAAPEWSFSDLPIRC